MSFSFPENETNILYVGSEDLFSCPKSTVCRPLASCFTAVFPLMFTYFR